MRMRSFRASGAGRWIARAAITGATVLAVTTGTLVAPTIASADEVDAEAKRVTHRVPFPCGQKWRGETRTNHSPLRAVDFNRRKDFGDRVTASARGRVVHRGPMAGTSYGRLVVIRHRNGSASYYAHLSKYRVRKGERVKKGEVIGKVGGSAFPEGNGYIPHLHYEQRTSYNGSSVKIKFNNKDVHYYGTRRYKSKC